MRLTGSRVYSRPAAVPKMPPGLVELMEGLSKDVLRHNPSDIYEFCASHMQKLLEIRDGRGAQSLVLLDTYNLTPFMKEHFVGPKQPLTLEQKILIAQEKVRQRAEQRRQKYDNEMKLLTTTKQGNDEGKPISDEKENEKREDSKEGSILKVPVHHELDLADALEVEIFHKPDDDIQLNKSCVREDETEVSDLLKVESHDEMKITEMEIKPKVEDVLTDVQSDLKENQRIKTQVTNSTEDIISETDGVLENNISSSVEDNIIDNDKQDMPSDSIRKPRSIDVTDEVAIKREEIEQKADNLTIDVIEDKIEKLLEASALQNVDPVETSTTVKITESLDIPIVSATTQNNIENIASDTTENTNEELLDTVTITLAPIVDAKQERGTVSNTVILMQPQKEINVNISDNCEENQHNINVEESKAQSLDVNVIPTINYNQVAIESNNIIEKEMATKQMIQDNGRLNDNSKVNPTGAAEKLPELLNETDFQDKSAESVLIENKDVAENREKVFVIEFAEDKDENVLAGIEPSCEINVSQTNEYPNVEKGTVHGWSKKDNVVNGEVTLLPDHENVSETQNTSTNGIKEESSDQKRNKDLEHSLKVPENVSANSEIIQFSTVHIPVRKSSSMDHNTIEDRNESSLELDTTTTVDELVQNSHNPSMDLETAAVTIQKVFRAFLFKSRCSTFDDTGSEEINLIDDDSEKVQLEYPVTSLNKERRTLGISRMDTVLQTVNEEKSLSLSTDDSSTISSAATVIQAHVRGYLVRNKLNSDKTTSSSLVNSDGATTTSIETNNDQEKVNKTILNIHIVPEGERYLSRDESIITSMDLSLDGSPPSSINLHPLGYDKSEPRKQLKREDAIQSVSPPSNNSGKLSEDSVKEVVINETEQQNVTDNRSDEPRQDADIGSRDTTPTKSTTIETVIEAHKFSRDFSKSPDQENGTETCVTRRSTLTKMSSDESDVVTPFTLIEDKHSSTDSDNTSKLLHSGEFHDIVLPTQVSRCDTSVVREFKNVLVYFLLWNNS